jgi:hypothetical protein
MQLRTLHTYVGMLIAPSVLFFACTGIIQIFSLHEAHGGYTPPPIVVKLSSVHKDQVFRVPHKAGAGAAGKAHKPKTAEAPRPSADDSRQIVATNAASTSSPASNATAPAPTPSAAKPPAADHGPKLAVPLLKWFFTLVALGLIGSTLVGVWMAWQAPLRRRNNMILLAIGVVIPIVLIVLSA